MAGLLHLRPPPGMTYSTVSSKDIIDTIYRRECLILDTGRVQVEIALGGGEGLG